MNIKGTKLLKLALAATLIAGVLAGCTKTNGGSEASNSPSATPSNSESNAPESLAYYDMFDQVTDSSDFPDWTGKQLKLKVWYTHGSGDAKRLTSEMDVVNPEIKRVTGVELDADASFDNGGQDLNVKMGMLNAANDWPDIAITTSTEQLKDLIAAGKVYDLTDQIEQYAPNLKKRVDFNLFPQVKQTITVNNLDGKIYSFPFQLGFPDDSLKIIDPNFVSPNPQAGLDGTEIWVRDDILKMLYPSAKTQDEIDALYVEKGKFSREDIYDVPIKSREDFIKLLYDIQDLIKTKGLKENGKPIEVTYAFGGQDNWNALNMLLAHLNRQPHNNNYFTYYDKTTKQLEFMFQQDFFKEGVRQLAKLVNDGVMDKNSLLENNASHLEKLNSGQYAVAYRYDTPDAAMLKAAGKEFRYRKIWIDAPTNLDQFIAPASPIGNGLNVLIFKDKVKEEDLPQIIRYLDYLTSEVGEKMYTWGPRSAGLFEETDGKRVFKDKALEDAMVYNQDNGASVKYNLNNPRLGSTPTYGGTWPYYPTYMFGGSTVAPVYAYEKKRDAAEALKYFDPGNLPGGTFGEHATKLGFGQNLWGFVSFIPEVDAFWKGRDAFEKALTKTLAAKNDEQFEELWNTFSNIAVKNGATPETLQKINEVFKEKNKGYIE